MRIRKFGLAILPLLVASLVAPAYSATAEGKTFLSFRSEPGDFVGLGENHSFTRSDGVIRAAVLGHGNQIHVRVDEADGTEWDLYLAAPAGSVLNTGAYTNVAIWTSQSDNSSQPTMSFSGDGRGCSTITGRFDVLDVSFGAKGVIQSFHATWEQHCEGFTPALFGETPASRASQRGEPTRSKSR